MADSLFDDQIDDNKDFLSELLGPGGKYDVTKYNNDREAAIKAMAKGKALADRTIDFKNKEFDELREDFLKVRAENIAKDKWEELLKTKGQQLTNDNKPDDTNTGHLQPSIRPEEIDSLLEKKLSEREAAKKEAENMAKVESRLREIYGDNARSVLKDKMNTLNISDEDVKFLAKRSPEAVINALGLNQQRESFQAPPRGSLRSDNFSTNNGEKRDYVFYDEMRRKEPKKYFSEKMSVQRLKDMDSDPTGFWARAER